MAQGPYRASGCRISDEFAYRGLRVCVLENELVRVSVLVDQGTDIFELQYKPLGIDVLYQTPRGVSNPRHYIASTPAKDGGFFDFYEGGWQECFPNGGRVCRSQGADFGLHGEVFGLAWDCTIVEDTPSEVAARFSVRTPRTPFLLEKTLRLRSGCAVLRIEERLTNESREAVDCMWGHHPAFGPPFLSDACVLTTGAQTAVLHDADDPLSRFVPPLSGPLPYLVGRQGWPIDISVIPAPTAVASDMWYLTDLDSGWYALTNTELQLSAYMTFDHTLFRHIWYWIACNAPLGSPFFGQAYAVALEPFTSYPAILTNTIEAGRQLRVGPRQVVETALCAGLMRTPGPPMAQGELPQFG